MVTETAEKKLTDSWSPGGMVFFTGGDGYGIASDGQTISLGGESQVKTYLSGGPLPDKISMVQREALILAREIQDKEKRDARAGDIEVKSTRTKRAVRAGSVGAGFTHNTKRQPVDTRHFAAGKGLPVYKVVTPTQGVFGGFGN